MLIVEVMKQRGIQPCPYLQWGKDMETGPCKG